MINKLLYITTYSASSEVEKLRKLTGQNPGYAIQKFSRLLSEGFIKNGVEVSTISILAVSRKNCKKLFWSTKKCEENGVNFCMHRLSIFRSLDKLAYSSIQS